MNRLAERMESALDLFLNACCVWAEFQCNQTFLDDLDKIKAEFKRISHQVDDEDTVGLIENLTAKILLDLDLAIKDLGLEGLAIKGTRH